MQKVEGRDHPSDGLYSQSAVYIAAAHALKADYPVGRHPNTMQRCFFKYVDYHLPVFENGVDDDDDDEIRKNKVGIVDSLLYFLPQISLLCQGCCCNQRGGDLFGCSDE